jgi:glyoxylase-like metal-dependent hydrolase (beta-lactamase superfamily II)
MIRMRPRALYVHVPFCARRCSYCDFAVDAVRRPPVDAWLAAVESELALVVAREAWTGPLELDTVYIGGGTPSLLGTGAMHALRERIARFAVWDDALVEWTAEANPESFVPELASDWAAAGVNRDAIDVVVISHFHGDHVNGLLTADNAAAYYRRVRRWADSDLFGAEKQWLCGGGHFREPPVHGEQLKQCGCPARTLRNPPV